MNITDCYLNKIGHLITEKQKKIDTCAKHTGKYNIVLCVKWVLGGFILVV